MFVQDTEITRSCEWFWDVDKRNGPLQMTKAMHSQTHTRMISLPEKEIGFATECAGRRIGIISMGFEPMRSFHALFLIGIMFLTGRTPIYTLMFGLVRLVAAFWPFNNYYCMSPRPILHGRLISLRLVEYLTKMREYKWSEVGGRMVSL